MLASTFSLPRCAMPITASSSGGRAASVSTASSSGISDSAPFEREPALADELGLQEHLERLGHVQPGQDLHLLVVAGPAVRPLDPRLQPGALLGFCMCMYSTPTVRQ